MVVNEFNVFIKKHQTSFDELNSDLHLSENEIAENFTNLKEILLQNEKCQQLPIDQCINHNFLHKTLIRNSDRSIGVSIVRCPKYITHTLTLIDEYQLSLSGKDMTTWWDVLFDQFNNGKKSFSFYKKKADENSDQQKNNSINLLADLYQTFSKIRSNHRTDNLKGTYLYGSYGVGKSLFMHFFCDQMHKLNLSTAFVNVNQLAKNAKKNIEEEDKSKFSKYYKDIKKADVLVLDDLGAEKASEWFYSEVLFGILDYRMNNKKLTYFTSNFSIDELQEKIKNKGNLNPVDAGRIIDRIRTLVNNQTFELHSINHRYDKNH